MKRFWRKTNRGLWLGAILLLTLLIFIVATEVRFNFFDKKTIGKNTLEFTKELLNINLAQEVTGEEGTMTAKEHQRKLLEQAIQTYWYSGSVNLSSRYFGADRLNDQLKNWQANVPGVITAINLESAQYQIDIQRQSPGNATATLYISNIKVSGTGPAPKETNAILFPVEEDGWKAIPPGQETWSQTCDFTISLQMVERGGNWLIAGFSANNGYGYYYSGLLDMYG